ncbi:MAG: hypothetical protein Q4G08_02920 [Capnocytophaga sp.]|nr:hypothetical protein [Capnocytophaga sp.]
MVVMVFLFLLVFLLSYAKYFGEKPENFDMTADDYLKNYGRACDSTVYFVESETEETETEETEIENVLFSFPFDIPTFSHEFNNSDVDVIIYNTWYEGKTLLPEYDFIVKSYGSLKPVFPVYKVRDIDFGSVSDLFNSYIHGKNVFCYAHKMLANRDVFLERRYFENVSFSYSDVVYLDDVFIFSPKNILCFGGYVNNYPVSNIFYVDTSQNPFVLSYARSFVFKDKNKGIEFNNKLVSLVDYNTAKPS